MLNSESEIDLPSLFRSMLQKEYLRPETNSGLFRPLKLVRQPQRLPESSLNTEHEETLSASTGWLCVPGRRNEGRGLLKDL